MTVQSDLQKALSAAEAAKGSYAMMENATEDQMAKQMYSEMKNDIDKHIQYLNGRMSYINQNNQLNS